MFQIEYFIDVLYAIMFYNKTLLTIITENILNYIIHSIVTTTLFNHKE